MFPNVIEDYLNVNSQKNGELNIINGNGQVVAQENVMAGNGRVLLNNLSTGMYMAVFKTDDNQVITQKLFVR